VKGTLRRALVGLLVAGGLLAAWMSSRGLSVARKEIRLGDYENTIHSQGGEDGILEKLFEVVPPTSRFAVEFGAGDGIRLSNVRHLITRRGWGGLLIEGDEKLARRCRENYTGFSNVRAVHEWVFPANVELLFAENNVPQDLDLLVIDIDSNDWYVWRAIRDYRPKVVMIEYNGTFVPPQKMVISFHPLMYWDEKDPHFGASIQSFYELGKSKGYELIGTNSRGLNLFFVDRKYYPRFGLKDNSPAALYRPYESYFFFRPADVRNGSRPGPSPDIVMPETRIRKRFRFDR
jgi:hypothetical protein